MKQKYVNKPPVVYAFIDSQNLNLGIRDQGWKLDFGRFRVYLKDKYHVTKVFLFIGYVPKYQRLYTKLKQFGYTLIFKPTLWRSGETKGNVDAELVLHSMIEWLHYDAAVIVSGDGDFHCLVEYWVKKRKLAKILAPNRNGFSALLRKFMKYVVFLDDLKLKTRLERAQKRGALSFGRNLRRVPSS